MTEPASPRDALAPLADIPDPWADALSAPLPPAPDLRRVEAPTRARRSAQLAIALLVAIGAQIAALFVLGVRRDLGAVEARTWAIGLAAPSISGLIALAIAARSRGGGRARIGLVAAIALFALGASLAAAWLGGPAAPSVRADLVCLALTAALAAPTIGLGAWAHARGFAYDALGRTALLGVGGGALAAATMHLHCPSDAAAHVLFGHGSALALGGLVGALLARSTRS